MLATLVREPFSDPNWIFEPKLDGIRCLTFRKGRGLTLFSRNQLRLNESYPELLPALEKQSCSSFVVDGEIVAFDRGVSRFSVLQKRRQIHVPVFYHLFDLLYLDGYDLTGLELRYRRKLLHDSFQFQDPLRYSQHRETEGQEFYKEACTRGWEGVIGKRGNSIYVAGRSMDWLKFKCENEQEFVIVGYSEPTGQRVGLGALLVGFHEDSELVYAGKVGTGFDTATLKELENKLKALERATPAVVSESLPRKGIHWVQPKLVAQIAFTEWTDAGKLRHPRYLGLRRDKKPTEVIREKPKDLRRR